MARPVFEPHVDGAFGGSEVRAYLFATGLANLGAQMHVLVLAHHPAEPQVIDNVTVNYDVLPGPLPRLSDELSFWKRCGIWPTVCARRLMKSAHKRCLAQANAHPSYHSTLASIDAEVLCAFGVHHHSASVIHTAKITGRPSVLLIASDADLSSEYQAGSTAKNDYNQRADVCHFALQNATQIITQSHQQEQRLHERFGRDSVCIRNPIPLDDDDVLPAGERTTDVLWIGRGDVFSKRADLALELATRCPALRFTMIMNPRDERVYRHLLARVPSNAQIIQQVAWRDIDNYFRDSSVLLNTSVAEGFPNTFLQAARWRIPIVSMNVDPDGMLSRHGSGFCVDGNVNQAASILNEICQNTEHRNSVGAMGRQYATTYHDAASRCRELFELLQQLAVGNRDQTAKTEIAAT